MKQANAFEGKIDTAVKRGRKDGVEIITLNTRQEMFYLNDLNVYIQVL